MLSYQVNSSYVISSAWENNVLTEIIVGTDDKLWECRVGDLKSPVGMESITFINLLRQLFLFDTSSMNIHQSEKDLQIDCNHSADGFTFTFASFKLTPSNRSSPMLFYQNAIMELVKDNIHKTKSAAALEAKMSQIEQVNVELEKEIKEAAQQNMKSCAALTAVFKRVINAKKRKIRSLASKITE